MQRYGKFINNEEDMAMILAIRNFVDNEVMPVRSLLDGNQEVFEQVYEKLVKLGIQRRGFSKKYGGLGIRSAPLVCALTEEIARGDSGIALHSLIVPWTMAAAMGGGNDVIKEKFTPMFCEDTPRAGCMAITEPDGGCNIEDEKARGREIKTIAVRDGDEWVINGKKMWPSGAGIADLYCVVCTTDTALNEDGVALIYVPKGTPGLTFGKPEEKMGMRVTDRNSAIFFDDVRVPVSYRAAGPGMDWKLFKNNISWGRLTSAPIALGNAQAVLETVISYTASRYYGGKSVRDHSLQKAIIGDLAVQIDSARALYLSVAEMFDDREKFGMPGDKFLMARASAAKVHACDVTERVCATAMELMGSYGYSVEYPVEKYLRDSKIIQIWLGGGHLGRLDVASAYYEPNTTGSIYGD